jgi:hypothetical protein
MSTPTDEEELAALAFRIYAESSVKMVRVHRWKEIGPAEQARWRLVAVALRKRFTEPVL